MDENVSIQEDAVLRRMLNTAPRAQEPLTKSDAPRRPGRPLPEPQDSKGKTRTGG